MQVESYADGSASISGSIARPLLVLCGGVTANLYRPTSSVVDNLTTNLIGLSVPGWVSKNIRLMFPKTK
jgi:hypothetical protein